MFSVNNAYPTIIKTTLTILPPNVFGDNEQSPTAEATLIDHQSASEYDVMLEEGSACSSSNIRSDPIMINTMKMNQDVISMFLIIIDTPKKWLQHLDSNQGPSG